MRLRTRPTKKDKNYALQRPYEGCQGWMANPPGRPHVPERESSAHSSSPDYLEEIADQDAAGNSSRAGQLIDYGSSNIIIEGWASPPAAVPELIVRRRARAAGERVILRFAKDFSPDDAAVPVVFVRAHLVDLCSDLGVGWQARLSWWIAGGLAGDSWTLFRTGSLEPTPDSFLDLPISDVGQFPR